MFAIAALIIALLTVVAFSIKWFRVLTAFELQLQRRRAVEREEIRGIMEEVLRGEFWVFLVDGLCRIVNREFVHISQFRLGVEPTPPHGRGRRTPKGNGR